MKRREFITLLGGATVAWPLAARAQQPAIPVIGFLNGQSSQAFAPMAASFRRGLIEAGYVEGHDVAIEYRWAEGRSSRAAEIAAEFVRLKVDVIVTYSTSPVLAAKQATSVIPIVFAAANDPVGAGLVANLARPGGNVTGLSVQQIDVAGKKLELLREVVPSLHRLAIMANIGSPGPVLEMGEAQAAARILGLEVTTVELLRAEDIAPGFDALKGRAEALYVCTDPLVVTNRARIHTLAMSARLPTIYNSREYVEAGGLMSYGPNWPDQFRCAAEIVDKILRGPRPHLKTAKALGLEIPPTLLARADR